MIAQFLKPIIQAESASQYSLNIKNGHSQDEFSKFSERFRYVENHEIEAYAVNIINQLIQKACNRNWLKDPNFQFEVYLTDTSQQGFCIFPGNGDNPISRFHILEKIFLARIILHLYLGMNFLIRHLGLQTLLNHQI